MSARSLYRYIEDTWIFNIQLQWLIFFLSFYVFPEFFKIIDFETLVVYKTVSSVEMRQILAEETSKVF